jgi:hypothetical protein
MADGLLEQYHKQWDWLIGVEMEIGYAWLLGPNRNVSLSLGFGLTRLFGNRANGYDAPKFMPDVRLANVGIAF